MTPSPLPLRDPEDFPALYRDADKTSLDSQRHALLATKIRLVALLVATAGGLTAWTTSGVQVGAAISLVAFLVALGSELYSGIVKPEEQWYEGRAAAESVKTLTWRYAVGGERFEVGAPNGEVDAAFVAAVREVLSDLGSLEVDSASLADTQISEAMRRTRAMPFADRKALYLLERIDDQAKWYRRKASENSRRAKQWLLATLACELVGVFFAALQAFASFPLDLMGLLAAGAATITGWVQLKQHRNLATAYGVTAHELAAVASEVTALDDERKWSQLVGQSEEAISREHTLWRASRGLRVRR